LYVGIHKNKTKKAATHKECCANHTNKLFVDLNTNVLVATDNTTRPSLGSEATTQLDQ